MYLDEEDKSRVRGENYEGRIWTNRDYEVMGQFSGMRFDAELDVNGVKGKVRLSFLVDERTVGRKRSKRVVSVN
ncbi:MAG: hypothetical protein A3D48_04330 [Candidatus Yanofskybacteria bacterium RIFCSPHIGHO2_02_FULL_43_17]|nr:MAG: hypothetical protein A3D48_04330 [Candidatus Yanofskybacteria bacterium RIFCSPHIGHO2_02_FULL_43_17]